MKWADSCINLSEQAVCPFNFQVPIPTDNLCIEMSSGREEANDLLNIFAFSFFNLMSKTLSSHVFLLK